VWAIRKSMNDSPEFVEQFLKRLAETKSNAEFLASLDTSSGKMPIGTGVRRPTRSGPG
jgi:transcription termination factor Rho